MDISVVVCTYNRCQSLAKALDSIAKCVVPCSTTWEVLVVDNNSADQTAQTVHNFRRKYPGRVRYFFEPRQGKSHALNKGVRHSTGDILAFLDDDTTADPNWLQRLTAPLSDPAWSGAGGPVILEWSCARPPWLGMEMAAPLVGFNPDRPAGAISEALFGGNMAFRRTMFERYGAFRTDLGPSPNREIPRQNEDTDFARRLLAAGERLYFEPSAVIFHPVPLSRLRKEYFLDWWFDKGRADILMLGVPEEMKWFVAGIPLRLASRAAVWTIRWMIGRKPSQRFSSRLKVQWLLGSIIESRRQSRTTPVVRIGDSVSDVRA